MAAAVLKDTVLVPLLGVLLHALQVLLVTLEAPGIVLRDSAALAALQPVVEHLRLLQPLQLHLLGVPGGQRTSRDYRVSFLVRKTGNEVKGSRFKRFKIQSWLLNHRITVSVFSTIEGIED